MPLHTGYIPGQYNFTCDVCGRGFKSSQMRKRWDGAITCNEGTCWEIRQPQDFVRGVRDDQSVPIARPRILPGSTVTTLLNPISATSVSFTVTAGGGINYPSAPPGKLLVSITSALTPTNTELILVGGHVAASDSFTSCTRGQGGTIPQAFLAGDLVNFIQSG
jgi:hypothetical protein